MYNPVSFDVNKDNSLSWVTLTCGQVNELLLGATLDDRGADQTVASVTLDPCLVPEVIVPRQISHEPVVDLWRRSEC